MTYQVEAVVVGGGPAGICAALALARQKKKTALIADRPVLGGNSSSEIRVWTRGATGGGNLYAEEMGIWGELKLRNLYLNVEGNPIFWDDVLLEQVLEEENLELFLNTHVYELQLNENRQIASVSAYQMGTEKKICFEGKVFIDATGDGTLGEQAGVPSCIGREGFAQYKEPFAPEREEKTTFGNTIFFFTKKEQRPVAFIAPSYAYSMERIENMLGRGGRIVNEKMNGCDYWWFEMGGNRNTIEEAQEIAIELKRLVAGVWNYIKNSGKFEADCLTLEWEGNLPGKRESRRMLTETVLRQQDIMEPKGFCDSAFYGGWYLDFHPADGVETTEDNCVQIPVQVYPIPLGCLYHKKVENLFFAGRNIGVSHIAFASTRIMNTCALSGQAAGTLAAECLEEHCAPEKLTRGQIEWIQQRLLDDDMLIPFVEYKKEQNYAAAAKIRVSSTEHGRGEPTGEHYELERGGIAVYPAAAGTVRFLVRAEKETKLNYKLYLSPLPSRAALGACRQEGLIELKRGEQWIAFSETACENGFMTAVIEANPDIAFLLNSGENPGFLLCREDMPGYSNPAVRFDRDIYGADKLTNGHHRLWNEPNMWMSRKEERPWAELYWQEEIEVQEILVFFNPDLNMELISSKAKTWDENHKYVPRNSMPCQLVKNAVLYGKSGKEDWKEIAALENNWRRRWKLSLREKIRVDGLRMEIISAYGETRAEVFEIRVY